MSSIKKPEIGDTVIIRGVVVETQGPRLRMTTIRVDEGDEDKHLCVLTSRISEVIPKPWEPKVGDVVVDRNYRMFRYKIICIHEFDYKNIAILYREGLLSPIYRTLDRLELVRD